MIDPEIFAHYALGLERNRLRSGVSTPFERLRTQDVLARMLSPEASALRVGPTLAAMVEADLSAIPRTVRKGSPLRPSTVLKSCPTRSWRLGSIWTGCWASRDRAG